MKKKLLHSDASAAQRSEEYVVGQVSGSLFQDVSPAGSLSALFSSAPTAGRLIFQPPARLVQKSSETQQQNPEGPEGPEGPAGQKNKKLNKKKSAAEQQLANRESGLLEADEDEQQHESIRKKKKKRKLETEGEKNAEHWVMKRKKMKAQKAEEELKKNRTVFVGNLPISCTKKTLRSLFRDKGNIESIRFRSMVREDPSMNRRVAAIQRKVHPKKQSMNAYVVFRDEDGVAKALERNGLEIEKDFHIRVDKVSDSSSHDHKRSVFVGNLSFEISDLVFRRHFEDCGSVEGVRLVRDQNSGLGKGFGYVLFESADSVQIALELDGSKLEGRSIRVKRSVKKDKKSDGKGTAGKSSGKGPGRDKGGPGRDKGGPGRDKGGPGRDKGGPGRDKGGPGRDKGGPGRDKGGPGRDKGGPGGFRFSGKQPSSFKGEMADPKKKPRRKGVKRKGKSGRSVHI